MKRAPGYTLYHPKWYRKRVSTYWWIGQWSHLQFILRELSSLFVAYAVILILLLLRAIGQGPESYAAFQERLKSPAALTLNSISLIFVLFHAITWFNLTPRAMPVRVGGRRLPDWMVALPNYVAWIAISAVVAWLITGGS
ncbi:MAG TPA: fumarate reductase subunit C [Blastocatellia bacterium]|nr:fumarate reductase subunit C [Blastocatellia bacterium]